MYSTYARCIVSHTPQFINPRRVSGNTFIITEPGVRATNAVTSAGMDGQQESIDYAIYEVHGSSSFNQDSNPTMCSRKQVSTFLTPNPLQRSPRECQLEIETAQLRGQLAILSSQRWNKIQAYNVFIDQVHILNTVLPSQHQTPQYRETYLRLLSASQSYDEVERQVQQQLVASHQKMLERGNGVTDMTADRKLQAQSVKDNITRVKPDIKSELIFLSLFLQSIVYHLPLSISNLPIEPKRAVVACPRQRLLIATRSLENNIASFTSFLTSEVVGEDLQAELTVKVEPGHVEMLSQDFYGTLTAIGCTGWGDKGRVERCR